MLVYFGTKPQLNLLFDMKIVEPTPPVVIDLSGYEYTEENGVAILTKFIGEEINIKTPGGKSQGVVNG
jgi:hypothetical protein